jgi:hypothetical protein
MTAAATIHGHRRRRGQAGGGETGGGPEAVSIVEGAGAACVRTGGGVTLDVMVFVRKMP